MCGRTSLSVPVSVLRDRFGVSIGDAVAEYVPQYNVAPSEGLVAVTNEAPEQADVLQWGLVPEWADEDPDAAGEPEAGPAPINARVESVAESNLFRSAFRNRRCLLLADGFYEWAGTRGRKQPYRVQRVDGQPFAFAGLWSRWEGGGGALDTATILTTEPNAVVEPIHDRMPVVLESDEEERWLSADVDEARAVLDPHPADPLEAYPVSKRVNDPSNDDPSLFDPVDVGEQAGLDDFAS